MLKRRIRTPGFVPLKTIISPIFSITDSQTSWKAGLVLYNSDERRWDSNWWFSYPILFWIWVHRLLDLNKFGIKNNPAQSFHASQIPKLYINMFNHYIRIRIVQTAETRYLKWLLSGKISSFLMIKDGEWYRNKL